MSSEGGKYKEITLGDSKIEIIDGDRGKNYPKASDFTSEGYCLFLNAKNVTPFGFSFAEKMFISKEKDEALRKGKLKRNDVVVTTRGTVGNVAYFEKKIVLENIRINSGMVILRCNEPNVMPKFLYWVLRSPAVQKQIASIKTGSAQPQLPISVMKNLRFPLPQIKEQKAIVTTLSCLDDMIELNNRTNKVLEEMAQAIFKHWFVDFEFPNENGEPYKSSGGEMEDSELGEIPLGWRIRQFTDIIEVTGGGTPKTSNHDYWDGEIPFFTPKDCNLNYYVLDTEKHITELGLENCNSKLYPTNTVFITARGTVGKIAIAGRPMAINQSCYALRYRGEPLQYYVHQITKNAVNELQHKASGAVFDAIVTRDFDSLKTIVPTTDLVRAYDSTISKTYELLRINNMQNVVLSLTRDTLLPKLMSGEIRVPMEEVG